MKLSYPLTEKHATRMLIFLVGIELILGAVFYFDFKTGHPSLSFHQLMSLDLESNIPTWFSTVQLFMIGSIPLLVALSENYSTPPSRRGLVIFGLGFIYLSIDEAAALHEKMVWEFHDNPLVPYFDGVHGVWITVYMAVAIIVLTVLFNDLTAIAKNFKKESLLFAGGMFVFLAGAGGAETITFFFVDRSNPLVYNLEVLIEEMLEMVGASILLYSVLLTAIKKTA